MVEIARKCFYSLNQDGNMFYVLNDGNYVKCFYCEDVNIAIEKFNANNF